MTFFTETERRILKFLCNHKLSGIAKTILAKKNETAGITLPDFKLYYKAIGIKAVWYWHKKRCISMHNRCKPMHIYLGKVIFNKGTKIYNEQWRASKCWENWIAKYKRMKSILHQIYRST